MRSITVPPQSIIERVAASLSSAPQAIRRAVQVYGRPADDWSARNGRKKHLTSDLEGEQSSVLPVGSVFNQPTVLLGGIISVPRSISIVSTGRAAGGFRRISC